MAIEFTNPKNPQYTMTVEQYNNDIDVLIRQVKSFEMVEDSFDNIFPIARGGYYPAIRVAKALNKEIILDEAEITEKTLIVDDLMDSGKTLAKYIGKNHVAVVYFKLCEKVEPINKNRETSILAGVTIQPGEWINFPDEHETTIEDNITRLLQFIGEDAQREGLKGTPDRIARMYKEIFRGYDPEQMPKITTFTNEEHESELIVDSGDYYSMCEHHMMPFFGKYCIGYLPNENGRILGISKVGRVVDYCSAKLQLQERLAGDIIKLLEQALYDEANPPKGFAIMMKGTHLCKSMRGVKKNGNMTVLHCTGVFKTDKELQKQFIEIAEKQI